MYIYVNVCNAFGPGDHPGGKHVLKMASSLDSVEERRRLQGRVRTQRYRDRRNEDARARRRQSDRDRQRAARQRERRRLQGRVITQRYSVTSPTSTNSSTSSKGRFAIATTLYQLRFSNNPHNTLWFTLGSHVRTPVGMVNSPRVSA